MGSILEGHVFEHDEGVEVDGQRVAGVEVHIVPASGGHQVLQEECATHFTRSPQCSWSAGAQGRTESAQPAVRALSHLGKRRTQKR